MQCQKCRSPLRFDRSLEDLNPAAFDILVGASRNLQNNHIPPSRMPFPQERQQLYDKVVKNVAISKPQQVVAPGDYQEISRNGMNRSTTSAMSFIMLSDSQVGSSMSNKSPEETDIRPQRHINANEPETIYEGKQIMSQDIDRMSRLFEILTARSDIDFPVCVECTDFLVKELQKRLEASVKERDAYLEFLKQLNADKPTNDEIRESQDSLAKAKKDEEYAIEELKRLEKEKEGVDQDIAVLEEEARALDIEEQKFWRDRNDFSMKLAEFQNFRDSVNLQYDHDSQILDKLQRTNVYNDTFCISHDDWPEINAAWGHTVLLLQTVADRLNYKFRGYQLKPMGSTSRIISYESISPFTSQNGTPRLNSYRPQKKTVLELFSSGDMPLGLTFMHRHFDSAMVAFLECMRQLGAHVEAETARETNARGPLALPYKIEGDKIGGISIKLGIAQDDAWSRACKFTLTCCKFLLAHASNVNTSSHSRTT